MREDDALRVGHAPLLDELGVEDLELPGVALPLRVEYEDDAVCVPGDGRPVEGSSVKFGIGFESDFGKFVQKSVANLVEFDKIRLKSEFNSGKLD